MKRIACIFALFSLAVFFNSRVQAAFADKKAHNSIYALQTPGSFSIITGFKAEIKTPSTLFKRKFKGIETTRYFITNDYCFLHVAIEKKIEFRPQVFHSYSLIFSNENRGPPVV